MKYVSILPDKLEGAPVESDTVAERSCTTRRLEAEGHHVHRRG